MYQLRDSDVLYHGRSTKADRDTFEELLYEFARDGTHVYFQGRPQTGLDPRCFEVLDEFYARDTTSVYLIGQKKLKAFGADPASFRALGFGYGRDRQSGYYLDKRLKGDPQTLKPFGDGLALDAKGVLWTNRRILGGSISAQGLRGQVAGYLAYFWNSDGVWFSEHQWKAVALPQADPSTFQVLREEYARDQHRLYHGGKLVCSLDGSEPRIREGEFPLVMVGGQVVYRGRIVSGCQAESAVIVDGYLVDSLGTYDFDGRSLGLFTDGQRVSRSGVVRRVLEHLWALLESATVLGDRPRDVSPAECCVVGSAEIELPGEEIVIRLGGAEFRGRWDGLDLLAGQLWTHHVYGRSFFRYLHSTGVLYPRGDGLFRSLLKAGGTELIGAVKEHSESCLPTYARYAVTGLLGDDREKLLPSFSYSSLAACSVSRSSPSATTNQARAKQILAEGEHLSEHPYVRHLAAQELYGLIANSPKTEGFLAHTGQAARHAWQRESDPALGRQWLAALDLLMARVWLDADRGERPLYKESLPYLQLLCQECFNLDLNLARMWEVQSFLGQDAQSVEMELRALVGDRRMSGLWSGLNLDYPSVDAWLAGARLRLLRHGPEGDQTAGAKLYLEWLEECIVSWTEPWVVADLLCDLEDICDGLDGLGRSLCWPQEPLYTRLSKVEYLVTAMPYEIAAIETSDQGWLVRGWPLGRRVDVELEGQSTEAYIGLRKPRSTNSAVDL
jgi:hypothetical protein